MRGKIRFLGLVMILVLFVAVFLVSALSWAQKKPPTPPPPPADPAIAYSAWYGSPDHKDLMVVNADGSNKRALVSKKGVHNNWPDWSPDGKQLVFTDNELGPTAINIINVDGTAQKRIVEFNYSWGPVAWSPVPLPDGQYKIAFIDKARLPDGTLREDNDLFLVNLDGTSIQQLTDTPNVNESPFGACAITWSPDANYIAAAAYDNVVIYRIDYDGIKFTATSLGGIIGTLGIEIMEIDWANTQNKLVICASWYDLWTVDVFNPTNVFRLTNTPKFYEHGPSWSPDDSQIVFVNGPGTAGGISVMNFDGTGARQIVAPQRGVQLELPQWRRNR
jgi:Tol biopolymer transport system component